MAGGSIDTARHLHSSGYCHSLIRMNVLMPLTNTRCGYVEY